MSVKAMTWVWTLKGIPAPTRLVLLALADWADDEGVAFPAVATIASKCELSIRTVQRHLRAAEQHGLLTTTQRSSSSLYKLPVHKVWDDKMTGVTELTDGGDRMTGGGDRLTRGDDTSVAPITIIEPSVESTTTTVPEWMEILSEIEKPEPDTVKRLLKWAVPHDDIALRETAYSLAEKWELYKAKRKNIWSTFQGWVRVAERRAEERGPIRVSSPKLNPHDSIAIEKAIADAGLHPGSPEAREMRRRLQEDGVIK